MSFFFYHHFFLQRLSLFLTHVDLSHLCCVCTILSHSYDQGDPESFQRLFRALYAGINKFDDDYFWRWKGRRLGTTKMMAIVTGTTLLHRCMRRAFVETWRSLMDVDKNLVFDGRRAVSRKDFKGGWHAPYVPPPAEEFVFSIENLARRNVCRRPAVVVHAEQKDMDYYRQLENKVSVHPLFRPVSVVELCIRFRRELQHDPPPACVLLLLVLTPEHTSIEPWEIETFEEYQSNLPTVPFGGKSYRCDLFYRVDMLYEFSVSDSELEAE